MLPAGTNSMVVLTAATTVGVAASFLGYDLARTLLSWGGGVGGAAIGGAVGWFGPALAGVTVGVESRLLLAALFGFVGSVLGYSLFPVLTRIVTGVAGFVLTAVPAYAAVSGRNVVDATSLSDPSSVLQPSTLLEAVRTEALLAGEQSTQFAAVALVAGGVTLVLAWHYYVLVAALVANVLGATILAYAVPVWEQWWTTGDLLEASALELSPTWFVVALVVGGAIQFARHYGRRNEFPRRDYSDPFE